MLRTVNFEDVGGFAFLGGLCQIGAGALDESKLPDLVKGQVAVVCRVMGILFQQTALYYFLSPHLKKTHMGVQLTGIVLSAGVMGLKVAGDIGGVSRERWSVIGSHISIEMINLGVFVATVVGVIFSKEHQLICVSATLLQLPYWGLKFYREVPHIGERTVIAKRPSFIREVPRETVPYIGRKGLIETVRDILSIGENVILKGEPGVGKTHLAIHLNEGAVNGSYSELKGVHVFETNAKDLIAGAGIIGTKEQRVKELFAYLSQFERVILFVDEIWQLVGTGIGMHGTTDLAGDFLTEIEGNHISVIGATTLDKESFLTRNHAFNDRFEWIRVEELTPEERIEVLKSEIKRQGAAIPDAFVQSIPTTVSLREAKRMVRLLAARMKRTGCTFDEACLSLKRTTPTGSNLK